MLILSHRGHCAKAPENTLEAFRQAIQIGVDGIETDVQISKDRQLILFHDRLLSNGRAVTELTQGELSDAVGYLVPTLDMALTIPGDILWNVEIKNPLVLEPLVSTLRAFCHSKRFLITSFWHPVIKKVSQRLAVDCGVLVDHRPFEQTSYPLGLSPSDKCLNTIVWHYPVIDKCLIKQTTQRGIRNFVYGVVTESDWLHCAELKIDGVITDYPETLLTKRKLF
jgi:glycerophosphoryl diester phosphodiesterase